MFSLFPSPYDATYRTCCKPTGRKENSGIVQTPKLMALAGIILAAGKGTRMKSDVPKVMHLCMGIPMVELVGRAMRGAGVQRVVAVVGHGAELVKSHLSDQGFAFALQSVQLGTGHAALMAKDVFASFQGAILITPGDTPLLTAEALAEVVRVHTEANSLATIASINLQDPTGYGRIVRNVAGKPIRIVEQKDASPEEQKITEVNSSVYCFDSQTLFRILPTLGNNNAQGEYYLTDVIAQIVKEGGATEAVCFKDPDLFMGVNDRWHLAEASGKLRTRILKSHALNGVTIIDPGTTFISPDVEIGIDTVIEPMTILEGKSTIGANCQIGPNSKLSHAKVGNGCRILASHVDNSEVGDDARIGPFAHLRLGSKIGDGVKIGNFVETKKTTMGDRSSAGHLAYLGDSSVGSGANIGAGTITCNYDGYNKHRTQVGDGAFIGSNSTLVAPVTIAEGAYVAAGSVITNDVEEDALALGRARQVEKIGWVKAWREKNSS